MKNRHCLIALLGLIFSSSLWADTPTDTNLENPNRHTGYYVEANAGTNLVYALIFSSEGSDQVNTTGGTALSFAFGKMFRPGFGLEAGYMYSDIRGADDEDDIESLHIPYLTTRFAWPIGERFDISAKLGLMVPTYTENHISEDDTTHTIILPFTGIGASYAATENLAFTVQYQGAFYLLAGIGQLTGGVQYRF